MNIVIPGGMKGFAEFHVFFAVSFLFLSHFASDREQKVFGNHRVGNMVRFLFIDVVIGTEPDSPHRLMEHYLKDGKKHESFRKAIALVLDYNDLSR